MTTGNDDRIRAFLADEARRAVAAAPSLDEAVGRLAPRIEGRPNGASQRLIVLLAATLLLVAALGTAIAVGSGLLPMPLVIDDPETEPMPELGIFEAVAGRIVYYSDAGLWGVDPAAPEDAATALQLTSEPSNPFGWSSDGTRLLIMRPSGGEGQLFVLHADGSETQVTERPMAIRGATISPDGSRVVFSRGSELYAVDADGGPPELLVEAHVGLIEDPTFSPDGTQIAYTDGAGDNNHHVWVINADGTDAHEIASQDCACHVYGLAWSPAGDRIALGLEGTIYTFATDGSDFTQIAGGDTTCGPADPCAIKLPRSAASPYWSPDGSQIAYTTGCADGAGSANPAGCNLAIADADGSDVRVFSFGASGPWHPGTVDRRAGG